MKNMATQNFMTEEIEHKDQPRRYAHVIKNLLQITCLGRIMEKY